MMLIPYISQYMYRIQLNAIKMISGVFIGLHSAPIGRQIAKKEILIAKSVNTVEIKFYVFVN